ncbi:Probable inactive receptor kinase At3g08680 [Linum grandiflorum]
MISRALTTSKHIRRTPTLSYKETYGSKSGSILDYSEDGLVGIMDDLPLVFCGGHQPPSCLSLREVLRASVCVMGESRLGLTEKSVLLDGNVYAVKRFRKVSIGRAEFGRRIQRLAEVSQKCEYLVPVTAYLYAKRIKFLLCRYYPMGSLADLLAGGREHGNTVLNWNQRLKIALSVCRAIAFIHNSCPSHEGGNITTLQMNVHGNIKASNVMINVDFTACLSDHGFIQLVDHHHYHHPDDVCQAKYMVRPVVFEAKMCQKSDIYNLGMMLLDMLGGSEAAGKRDWINAKRKEEMMMIEGGGMSRWLEDELFEFKVEGKGMKQALQVLDIALACTNKLAEGRPNIQQILNFLEDVIA